MTAFSFWGEPCHTLNVFNITLYSNCMMILVILLSKSYVFVVVVGYPIF